MFAELQQANTGFEGHIRSNLQTQTEDCEAAATHHWIWTGLAIALTVARNVCRQRLGRMLEKGKQGKKREQVHLRSLDVLICFSNKAALWAQVLLIWRNLRTAEQPTLPQIGWSKA